jgi:hypothetical protein
MSPRVDYELHGRTYATQRRSDPRIAARIHAALDEHHGHLRRERSFDGGLRLLVSEPA